jgi:hypothetical protein
LAKYTATKRQDDNEMARYLAMRDSCFLGKPKTYTRKPLSVDFRHKELHMARRCVFAGMGGVSATSGIQHRFQFDSAWLAPQVKS